MLHQVSCPGSEKSLPRCILESKIGTAIDTTKYYLERIINDFRRVCYCRVELQNPL